MRNMSDCGANDLCWGKMISVIGLYTPLPIVVYPCLGDGFDLGPDLVLVQLFGANPGGVISATHVAYLVNPGLQGADPTADEGAQNVVYVPLGLVECLDHLVDHFDLEIGFLRIKTTILLLIGWWKLE